MGNLHEVFNYQYHIEDQSKENLSPIINVRGVAKSYGGIDILKDITFQINPGTFCSLLGENGAGKSTLLNVLMGQECADRGEGEILGADINHDLGTIKNYMGLVTEKINYDLPITVGKFFEKYASFFANWDDNLFRYLMKERDLDIKRQFRDYSRGQKMQTALIAAMSIRPKILLIDEITAVLDIYARKFFMELLKRFTLDGGTVLITTNIISEIQFATDRIIIINDGQIQINEKLSDIPSKFVKIRKLDNKDQNAIYEHPRCFWSGQNSDGSVSFLVPAQIAAEFNISDKMKDRRSITLDEIFIYYIKTGEKHLG